MAESVSASSSPVKDDLKKDDGGGFKATVKDDFKPEVGDNNRPGVKSDSDESPSKSMDQLNTITVIKARDTNGVQLDVNGTDNADKHGDIIAVETEDISDNKETVLTEKSVVTRTSTTTVVGSNSETNTIIIKKTDLSQDKEWREKSESPSEELQDSIEETLANVQEDIQHTKGSMNDNNDDNTKETTPPNDKDNDVKEAIIMDHTKDTKEPGSVHVEQETRISTQADDAGASSKISKAEAGVKDRSYVTADEGEEFRAMTEEEIQAIIKKYSFMDPEMRRRCLRFFWSMDIDRWGYFNYPQLKYWYRAQGTILTDREICRIFVDLDKDGDRLVSLDEFLLEMSKDRPRHLSQEELKNLFKFYDKNQDGYVCAYDLEATMDAYDPDYPLQQFLEYDVLKFDRTGEFKRLDFRDFCQYMRQVMEDRMPKPQF